MNEPTQDISVLLRKYNNAATKGAALRRAAAGHGKKEDLEADLKVLATPDVIDEKDSNANVGRTALHQAVANENKPAVELLLQHGAKYDIEDAKGDTVLCMSGVDEEIKRVLLLHVTNELTKKVVRKYQLVETDVERNAQVPEFVKRRQWSTNQFDNFQLVMMFIINALLYEASNMSQIPKTSILRAPHLQAYEQLKSFIKMLIHTDVCKSAAEQFSVTMNFCGILCADLMYLLLKQKAFINGKISVSYVQVTVGAGEHEVIIVNGTHTNIGPNTILCNAMRGDVYIGENAKKYLDSLQADKITTTKNAHPNFEDFLYCKTEIQDFLQTLKKAYIFESQSSTYQGHFMRCLAKMAYDVIADRPKIAELIFIRYRENTVGHVEDLIRSFVRDYKPPSFATAASFTSLPPPSAAAKSSTGSNGIVTAANQPIASQRKTR